jgi:hypothetical protein
MHNAPDHPKPAAADKDTARVESFSDGVFSVAMTLLVVGLTVPALPAKTTVATPSYLWHALGKNWPSYFAFLTSFSTVLIMWMNHHAIFKLIRRTDGTLLFANGFFIAAGDGGAVPHRAGGGLSAHPRRICGVRGLWRHLCAHQHRLRLRAARRPPRRTCAARGKNRKSTRASAAASASAPPLYFLATLSGAFSPWVSLGICSALWLYWGNGRPARRPGVRRVKEIIAHFAAAKTRFKSSVNPGNSGVVNFCEALQVLDCHCPRQRDIASNCCFRLSTIQYSLTPNIRYSSCLS